MSFHLFLLTLISLIFLPSITAADCQLTISVTFTGLENVATIQMRGIISTTIRTDGNPVLVGGEPLAPVDGVQTFSTDGTKTFDTFKYGDDKNDHSIRLNSSITMITPADGTVICNVTNANQMKIAAPKVTFNVDVYCAYALSGNITTARSFPINITTIDTTASTSTFTLLTTNGLFQLPTYIPLGNVIILNLTQLSPLQSCRLRIPSINTTMPTTAAPTQAAAKGGGGLLGGVGGLLGSVVGGVINVVGGLLGAVGGVVDTVVGPFPVTRPILDIDITCSWAITSVVSGVAPSSSSPLVANLTVILPTQNITIQQKWTSLGTFVFPDLFILPSFTNYVISIITSPPGTICTFTRILPASSSITCLYIVSVHVRGLPQLTSATGTLIDPAMTIQYNSNFIMKTKMISHDGIYPFMDGIGISSLSQHYGIDVITQPYISTSYRDTVICLTAYTHETILTPTGLSTVDMLCGYSVRIQVQGVPEGTVFDNLELSYTLMDARNMTHSDRFTILNTDINTLSYPTILPYNISITHQPSMYTCSLQGNVTKLMKIIPTGIIHVITCVPKLPFTTTCLTPLYTSPSHPSTSCMITLLLIPYFPLSFQFKSNDTMNGISDTKAILTSSNGTIPINVMIHGVYTSSMTINTTYCIDMYVMNLQIQKPFIIIPCVITVVNINIAGVVIPTIPSPTTTSPTSYPHNITSPSITSVSPSHIPLLGRLINITGMGFQHGMKAFVSEIETNVTFWSSTLVTIMAPIAPSSNWSSSYHTLTLINPDQGNTSCPYQCHDIDRLFYSETLCPQEGMYGEGLGCVTCPSNGVCPGGNRIWPKPGYWNPNEFSNINRISSCSPPAEERCIGGRDHACGMGYEGDLCAQCSLEYYADGIYCRSCRSNLYDGELAIVILVTAAFILSLGAGIAFMSNRWLDRYFIAIVTFQQIIAVYGSLEPHLPTGSLYLYKILRIFLFDYSFVKPDCLVGKYTFVTRFYASIILTLIVILYFLLCSLFFTWNRRRMGKAAKPRAIRALILAIHVMYLQLTIKILQTLNCKTVAATGELSLVVEQSQICYDSSHAPAAAVAWFLLFSFSLVVPCAYLVQLYHIRDKMTDYVIRNNWGFLYRGLQAKYWWYRICIYGFSFLFALQIAIFDRSILIQMAVATLILGIKVCFSLLIRPMIRHIDNVYSIIAGNASLTSTSVFLFMVRSPMLAGIFLGVTLFVTIISFLVGWYIRKDKSLEQEKSTHKSEDKTMNKHDDNALPMDARIRTSTFARDTYHEPEVTTARIPQHQPADSITDITVNPLCDPADDGYDGRLSADLTDATVIHLQFQRDDSFTTPSSPSNRPISPSQSLDYSSRISMTANPLMGTLPRSSSRSFADLTSSSITPISPRTIVRSESNVTPRNIPPPLPLPRSESSVTPRMFSSSSSSMPPRHKTSDPTRINPM